MRICGIYAITNIKTGKVYVGQSSHIRRRRGYHFFCLRSGTHSNRHLQSSFNLYGLSSFSFDVLESTTPDSLNDRERYWIQKLSSSSRDHGYNISLGGDGGVSVSDETRALLSKINKGRPRTAGETANLTRLAASRIGIPRPSYVKERVSLANKGRKASAALRAILSEAQKNSVKTRDHLRRLSDANIGTHLSDDHKLKLSIANKGKVISPEARIKMSAAKSGRPWTASRRASYESSETKQRAMKLREERAAARLYKLSHPLPMPIETRLKISEAKRGRMTSAHKQAIAAANSARVFSDETRKKMSHSAKERCMRDGPPSRRTTA